MSPFCLNLVFYKNSSSLVLDVICECVSHITATLCRLDSVSLDTASPNVIDLALATEVEHCECPQGHAGISCEVTLLSYLLPFLFSKGKKYIEGDTMMHV